MKSAIQGIDHVGLPSQRSQWGALRVYWMERGLDVWEIQVKDDNYDDHGQGPRLHVGHRPNVMLSYFIGTGPGHVAFKLAPDQIDWARESDRLVRETHWGHSQTSVFHGAPDTFPAHPGVELATQDPAFHRDHD